MDLLGILVGLALLVLFAFRGWSVLLLAPVAALVAAAFGREPLLANWTQIFMGSAARFLAQFFPIFLLGAVFGKLMDDSQYPPLRLFRGWAGIVGQTLDRFSCQYGRLICLCEAGHVTAPTDCQGANGMDPRPSSRSNVGRELQRGRNHHAGRSDRLGLGKVRV